MRELSLQKVINKVLSEAFQKEMLPEFWFTTITWVRVSRDFSYADVFISNYPINESVIDFLNSKIWHFQWMVNKALQRKVVPKIRFGFDKNWAFLDKIDKIK